MRKVIFLILLSGVIGLYQNCSDVGFKSEDSIIRTSENEYENDSTDRGEGGEETSDTGSFNEQNGQEIVLKDPDSKEPKYTERIGKFTKNVPSFAPKEGPLEVIILVDNSKSNAVYSSNVINGLRDLIDQIPKEILGIKVYTIGSSSGFTVIDKIENKTEVISDTVVRETTTYGVGGTLFSIAGNASMSEATYNNLKTNLVNAVQSHLASTNNIYDEMPTVYCENLALLSERLTQNPDNRIVFVTITDEDSSGSSKYTSCTKRSIVEKTKVGETTHFYLRVDYKRLLEAGGFTYTSQTMVYATSNSGITSCSQVTKEAIDAWIASQNGRVKANAGTYTSCTEHKRDQYTSQQILRESWLGNTHPIPPIVDEMKMELNEIGQAQVYMGLFSIINASDIVNQDQEIATNIKEFINLVYPPSNYSFQSLTNPNYGQFIDKVLNFKMFTEINRVSIQELIDQIADPTKFRVLSVKLIGQNITTTNVSFQGGELVIHDERFNLSLGAQLEITYSY